MWLSVQRPFLSEIFRNGEESGKKRIIRDQMNTNYFSQNKSSISSLELSQFHNSAYMKIFCIILGKIGFKKFICN